MKALGTFVYLARLTHDHQLQFLHLYRGEGASGMDIEQQTFGLYPS
jgi:hypothetical protein